ncbi:hypothetical protein V8E51_014851 [Hyaloscypha variabilis]
MSSTTACLPTVIITSTTNLGPLTTPITFPAICTNQFDFHTTILGQPEWSTLRVGGCALSQCCPSSQFYTSGDAWYSSYFSPGVCPQGYQTCDGPTEVEQTLPPGESVRFCCPIGYTCPLWPCYSICATLRTSATTALVVDNIVHQSIYSTETLPAPTGTYTPYDYAYPIQIRWKDSDFAAKTSSGATSAETSSGPTSGASKREKKLSTGAIAAIAVLMGLLAGLLLGLWWSRKKRKANSGTVAVDAKVTEFAKAEMDGGGVPARELDNNQIYELGTHTAIRR